LVGMGTYGMWKQTTMSVYQNPAGNKLPQTDQQQNQQPVIDVTPQVTAPLPIPNEQSWQGQQLSTAGFEDMG
jgi:hypothetical protein